MIKKHYNGFTLIEMSIVLAIIGLIVGGVLVGRDIIHTAEIRNTIGQYEQFGTAVNTFKNKYNCLPGDCVNADNIGFSVNSSGDGNGIIGYNIAPCGASLACMSANSSTTKHEYLDFWYQLSAAALIPYAFKEYSSLTSWNAGIVTPPTKIQPYRGNLSFGWAIQADLAVTVDTILPAHNFMLTSNPMDVAATGMTTVGGYLPLDMWRIDKKIDDGQPHNGIIRAWNNIQGSYIYTINSFGPTFPCVLAGEYNVQYVGTSASSLCGIAIKAPF